MKNSLIVTSMVLMFAASASADLHTLSSSADKTQDSTGALKDINATSKVLPTDGSTSGAQLSGYNGIQWGQSPKGIPFLKYVFTDPATGVNVYINAADPSENGRDWRERTQYHFWNDQFFKLTQYLPDQKSWEYVKNTYTRQLGRPQQNQDNPYIFLWEDGEIMTAMNFDDSLQEGSLTLASKSVAEKINALESSAYKSLVAALLDRDADVRARAAMNLGVMNEPRATLALLPLLKDQSFIVRYNTAYALGEIKDRRAVQSLIAALHDEDDFVRSFAAEALGKIGGATAIPALIESVGENKSAATALQEITGKDFGKDQQNWEIWWRRNQKTSL